MKAGTLKDISGPGEKPKFFNPGPSWFIPKRRENYQILKGKDANENFYLFIDRATGELHYTNYQV